MAAGLISSAVWFAVFLVGQFVAFRLRPSQKRTRTIFRLFGFIAAAHVLSIILLGAFIPTPVADLGSNAALSICCGLLVLACLLVLYMPFYYSLNTSLSVETMAMLGRANGHLPIATLEHWFCSPDFLRDRLMIMEANGYFEAINEDKWMICERGRRIAGMMSQVKRLLNLGPGG